jgi:hypothetical protein
VITNLTVTIPLAVAIALRDDLLQAREDRKALARIHTLSGEAECLRRDTRTGNDALHRLRVAMGEADYDAPPAGPRRSDTTPGMRVVKDEE